MAAVDTKIRVRQATVLLKARGFILIKSNGSSYYFTLPGRQGLFRLSDHRRRNRKNAPRVRRRRQIGEPRPRDDVGGYTVRGAPPLDRFYTIIDRAILYWFAYSVPEGDTP